jgi:hypothetical protein
MVDDCPGVGVEAAVPREHFRCLVKRTRIPDPWPRPDNREIVTDHVGYSQRQKPPEAGGGQSPPLETGDVLPDTVQALDVSSSPKQSI